MKNSKQIERLKPIKEEPRTIICRTCRIEKDVVDFPLVKNKLHCRICTNLRTSERYRKKNPLISNIYVMINPAWPEYVKIGRSDDIVKRLRGYQTYSPFRDYEICYSKETGKIREIEEYFFNNYGNKEDIRVCEWRKNEWYRIDKEKAINIIEDLTK